MATSADLLAEQRGLAQAIEGQDLGELLTKEWLLTNARGSYASGTVVGCNTRRYHGLLIASLHPPVERVVTLSNVLETLAFGDEPIELANFEFSDRLHPQGYRYLKCFRRDVGVHFDYDIGGMSVTKSYHLCYEHDHLLVTYRFVDVPGPLKLRVMPMIALRDFHGLQSAASAMQLEVDEQGHAVRIFGIDSKGPAVSLQCERAQFVQEADWWYAVHYRQDRERGQQFSEDVWVPGCFECEVTGDCEIAFCARAGSGWQAIEKAPSCPVEMVDGLWQRRRELHDRANLVDDDEKLLAEAADQFIVRRQITLDGKSHESASILAGYHWFADWGRDTFISLPGLLLNTGRYDEARQVLQTFASVVDQGQIPNRFDDYGGPPHYNSVDASLWFVNAAYAYLQTSQDRGTYDTEFLPTIEQILRAYHGGTRDRIHADEDGLISAGDEQTQLTWMDARCDGVSFTPRQGKAVEVNALWVNALRIWEQTCRDDGVRATASHWATHAETSFRASFWNAEYSCLYDAIHPDGRPDASVRPNQIFAVSLPFSCLSGEQQLGVVKIVQEHLLTAHGLRSLSPYDPRYRGQYAGDQFSRDSAYHQGTVWGFLMGAFVEAYLKAHHYEQGARDQTQQMIQPLLNHLRGDGCLGNVAEIFEGQAPHGARGCIAQAWSVAELLRCKQLISKGSH